jgi:hypothetical protein
LLRNPWLNEMSRLASMEVKSMETANLASVAAGFVLATLALAQGTNIGIVYLDADELKFAPGGSLTLNLSKDEPTDANARANWLPAPEGQFALIIRAYVPEQAILAGSYRFPNVERR